MPLYIRFGEIPHNQQSVVHRGDCCYRSEGGVSVWKAVASNGQYYPMLPKHPNKNTLGDYFDMLLHNDKKVYLVIGDEIFIEGADREPLLTNIHVIKEITETFKRD